MIVRNTRIVTSQKGLTLEMDLSNQPDVESASEMMKVRTQLDLKSQDKRLVVLQREALEDVRNAIDAEIQRLLQLAQDTR